MNRFKFIILAGIFMGVVFFFVITYLLPNLSKKNITIGITGEFTTDNLPLEVTNLISSGLTKIDTTGKAVPGIAEAWEASDSGKIWTFHINRNIFWQDGSKVTSKNINYNFSDATISKPDNYTIVFTLKTGLAPFPVNLSKPVFKKGLLGTGPWRVQQLTLAGNFIDMLTLSYGDSVMTYKFYPNIDRAKLAYQLGEVDKLADFIDPKPFDTWKVASVTKIIDKQKYVAVFFNTSDDLLTDKSIRQALTYAINKDMWKDIRAYGPISPNSWAYDPSVKAYDYDATHAKELITESKIDPNQKKNLKITLTTTPDLLSVANKIVDDWKKISVTTNIQVTQFVPDSYQAFLAISNIPIDPDQYGTWHSTQTQSNITGLKDPRIDKLLEDGRLETNETKRKAIYFDFQKYLVEDAPAAFLYYPTFYSVSR